MNGETGHIRMAWIGSLVLVVILVGTGVLTAFEQPNPAYSATSNVSYMNLRFVKYKAPVGVTAAFVDGVVDPVPSVVAPTLHRIGINGIRYDGADLREWTVLGDVGYVNAFNNVATAFDQQGISVVFPYGCTFDDPRQIPPDLWFYALSNTPPQSTTFGGSAAWSTVVSTLHQLYDSNAIYWGQTTNYQYTATNGTVVPAGKFSWPWAAQFSGSPIWQVCATMQHNELQALLKHPSTYAFKLVNEPYAQGTWTAVQLSAYDNYFGQKLRSEGWTGYIAYSSLNVAPTVSDIENFAPKNTGGQYLFPLMFEFHYPSATDLANVQSAVAAMGGPPNMQGWDGEDWKSYLNGQNGAQPTAQQQAPYGITANAYDVSLVCGGVDLTASCQPTTAGLQQLLSAYNSAYGQPSFFSSSTTSTMTSTSSLSTSSSSSRTSTSFPTGRRIGFWIADDDVFTTGTVYGLPPLPWTAQQFYSIYFNSPPYPATMLWASGLVSSGAASIPSDQEAQWLGQVATIADGHPNNKILMLFFVNLSGNSIETTIASHSSCFTVKRASPLTQFNICGLSASTSYTIALQDINHTPVATIGSFTTNSTGGFSGTFAIPNEPQTNNLWYTVVSGTSLYAQVALQADQTQQLTSYMNNLKGHSSIPGALFEPEYFGNTPAIQAAFRNIIVGAGYQNLVGQTGSSDPILAYSSYPYFGGALQTSTQANQIGIHYGETGAPIPPDPQPIWTPSTVLNIVDHSANLPCTIIISSNDVNNPAGNTYLWASPTLRGWIANDPYYQSNYLTSIPASSTTSSSTQTAITSTITSTFPPASSIDISFSSYATPFTYGTNFQTAGNSFPIQVSRPTEVNMIAFYFSDRAYDTNPVPFTVTDPSNTVMATGTIPALLQFASQQYYPIQLSQVITLQAGVKYRVNFAPLPAGDTYGTAGITQDILQEAASSPGTGYLGQSQWPIFQLGLMNLLTQGQGLAYHNYGAYTDLFSSPGYQGTGEIAMRFQASQNEQLQSFEVYVWSSDGSTNQVAFALRPDASGHPGQASSNLAMVSLPSSQMTAGQFAKVTFPNTPVAAGAYYWIVMSAPAGTRDVQFGRLVSPYREYVLYTTNDFQTWGVPPDGPSDLGFRISTTGESIVNTVSGSSQNSYFSGIAQSFIASSSGLAKGAWVSAKPAGQMMTVSIQSDNGNDQPSGTALAQGTDSISTQFTGGSQPFVYVGFSSQASLTSGTKYWLVTTIGACPSSCSIPSVTATLQFRSDYFLSGFAPQAGTHYSLLSGSTWQPVANGAMPFVLVSPTGHEGDPIWGSVTTTSVQTYSGSGTSTSTVSLTVASVTCASTTVAIGTPMTCRASVAGNAPRGTVTFWTNDGLGRFSRTECALSKGVCQVRYTATAIAPATINAWYSGDSINPSAYGQFNVSVTQRISRTTISCNPSSIAPTTRILCTAVVAGYMPTGNMTYFQSGGIGTVGLATENCTLAHKGSTWTTSRCSVRVIGTSVVRASYGGDSNNLGSTNVRKIRVSCGVKCSTVEGLVVAGPATPSCPALKSCNVNMSGYYLGFTRAGMTSSSYFVKLFADGSYAATFVAGNYSVGLYACTGTNSHGVPVGCTPSCPWVGCSSLTVNNQMFLSFPLQETYEAGQMITVDIRIGTGIA